MPSIESDWIECEWCGIEFILEDEVDNGADDHFCSNKCRNEMEANLNSHEGDK